MTQQPNTQLHVAVELIISHLIYSRSPDDEDENPTTTNNKNSTTGGGGDSLLSLIKSGGSGRGGGGAGLGGGSGGRNNPPPHQNTIKTNPSNPPLSSENKSDKNKNIGNNTPSTTATATNNKNDDNNNQQRLQQKQKEEDSTDNVFAGKYSCLLNPVSWWTHRALSNNEVFNVESNQAAALCLHITLAATSSPARFAAMMKEQKQNNKQQQQRQQQQDDAGEADHATSSGGGGCAQVAKKTNSNINKKTQFEPAPAVLIFVLCGSDQVAAALREKIRSEFPQRLQPLVRVRSLIEQQIEKQKKYQPPEEFYCTLFLFGWMPSSPASRCLESCHGIISQHMQSATRYCIFIGHCLWPLCDGPMRPVIDKASRKIKELTCTIPAVSLGRGTKKTTTAIDKDQLDNNDGAPSPAAASSVIAGSSAFSSCIAVRCCRHPESVNLLTSAMPFAEMLTAMRCTRTCGEPLSCGVAKHRCSERCHSYEEHVDTPCEFPCSKTVASCGHTCMLLCGEEPCDCLKRVKHELPCGHVTLHGHYYLRHRFDGSCAHSHKPCSVSVPVRCSHCYGVSFEPCSEMQEEFRKNGVEPPRREQQLQTNNNNNNTDSNQKSEDAAVGTTTTTTTTEQEQEQEQQQQNLEQLLELPVLPESFKCKDCREAEFKIRSQLKFQLTREAEEEKKQIQQHEERSLFEQKKAARQGIFQVGQQAVVSSTASVLDADLASAIFEDIDGDKWSKAPGTDLENVVGAIVARQNDPTNPTALIYVLSVPTHGGLVAVGDDGLSLVRAVHKSDHDTQFAQSVGAASVLMIRAKEDTENIHNNNNNNDDDGQQKESGKKNKHQQHQQQANLDPGTRVVVLKGTIASKNVPPGVLCALYHPQSQQNRFADDYDDKKDYLHNIDGDDNAAACDDGDDVDEEEQQEEHDSSSSSDEVDVNSAGGDASAEMMKGKRGAKQPRNHHIPETIPITNVIGSVVRYIENDDADHQSIDQDSATKLDDDAAKLKVVVNVDLIVYYTDSCTMIDADDKTFALPQRRQRDDDDDGNDTNNNRNDGGDDTTTSPSTAKKNNGEKKDKKDSSKKIKRIFSQQVTLAMVANALSVVPVFPTGTVVRVREPLRHVHDQLERDRFGINLDSIFSFGETNNNNAFPSSPSGDGDVVVVGQGTATSSDIGDQGNNNNNNNNNDDSMPAGFSYIDTGVPVAFHSSPARTSRESLGSTSAASPHSPRLSGIGSRFFSNATSKNFLANPLPDSASCIIQGFLNAPRASVEAVHSDTLLRNAIRRGPCYLVSKQDDDVVGSSSMNQRHNGGGGGGSDIAFQFQSSLPLLAVVPVFFADLDTDELADQHIAGKIREELDTRTKEQLDEYLDEIYVANREVAEKRMKTLLDDLDKQQQQQMKKQKITATTQNENNDNTNDGREQQQQHHALHHHQHHQSYATIRIGRSDAEEREATQRYMKAKRHQISVNATLNKAGSGRGGGGVGLPDLAGFAKTHSRERDADKAVLDALLHQLK